MTNDPIPPNVIKAVLLTTLSDFKFKPSVSEGVPALELTATVPDNEQRGTEALKTFQAIFPEIKDADGSTRTNDEWVTQSTQILYPYGMNDFDNTITIARTYRERSSQVDESELPPVDQTLSITIRGSTLIKEFADLGLEFSGSEKVAPQQKSTAQTSLEYLLQQGKLPVSAAYLMPCIAKPGVIER